MHQSTVQPSTPGGQLGSGARQSPPPCFGQPPGLQELPSRPLPPMSSTGSSVQTTTAQSCPRIWQPFGSRPKCPPASSPPGYPGDGAGSGGDGASNPPHQHQELLQDHLDHLIMLDKDLLIHGHHLIVLASLYHPSSYHPLTAPAASWTCVNSLKIGSTSLPLPLQCGEEMLNDIGWNK